MRRVQQPTDPYHPWKDMYDPPLFSIEIKCTKKRTISILLESSSSFKAEEEGVFITFFRLKERLRAQSVRALLSRVVGVTLGERLAGVVNFSRPYRPA